MKSMTDSPGPLPATIPFLGKVVASWVAVHDPQLRSTSLTNELLSVVLAARQEHELVETWQRLDAWVCIRRFYHQKPLIQTPGEVSANAAFYWQDQTLWWSTTKLGSLETFYQHPLPQETQAQIAYEIFRMRFFDWLQHHEQAIVIRSNDVMVSIFVPERVNSPDMESAWQRYVIQHAFSAAELQKTFVLLLNSTLLSDRGFSIPDMPIVTQDQADILIALFYATLHNVKQRLQRLEKERTSLLTPAAGTEQPKSLTSKEETTLQQLEKRLTKQHGMYDAALQHFDIVWEKAKAKQNLRARRIQELARSYKANATKQLKVTGNVMAKAVTRMEELLTTESTSSFTLPLLFSRTPPVGSVRSPGDYNKGLCFACGQIIPQPAKRGNRVKYTANKLILGSPSQTLQGHFSQVQPEVCPTCAVLAMISPVKMVRSGLVVRLSEWNMSSSDDLDTHKRVRYLYEHQLRMLTTGELNVVAGRYLMISCTEQTQDQKPLIQRMGGKEYALFKMASLFPEDVLMHVEVEAFFGTKPVRLMTRHLVALRFLFDLFPTPMDSALRSEAGSQYYAALSDAIRFIEKDQITFALYRFMLGFQRQSTYTTVQRSILEHGLRTYQEILHMDDAIQLEERLCDIAGLTGVLLAFVEHVRSNLTKDPRIDPKQRERELKKLLEEVDNPNQFTYEATGSLSKQNEQSARLWKNQQNHFIYDEARRLLQNYVVADINERESHSDNHVPELKFYYDDICKIYAALYKNRYPTQREQRDFTYELKLSLYSRCPDLRPGNQSDAKSDNQTAS